MQTTTATAGLQNPEECRICAAVIGVVYSPLLLLAGVGFFLAVL